MLNSAMHVELTTTLSGSLPLRNALLLKHTQLQTALCRSSGALNLQQIAYPRHKHSQDNIMATRSFTTSLAHIRTPLLAVSFGLTATVCLRQQLGFARPLRLDSAASGLPRSITSSFSTYGPATDAPLFKNGRLNPKAVKQVSTGSILGKILHRAI